jgi:hypothetical protein
MSQKSWDIEEEARPEGFGWGLVDGGCRWLRRWGITVGWDILLKQAERLSFLYICRWCVLSRLLMLTV